MKVRILYHDHCFDGSASAAYFSRFLKDAQIPAAEFHYTGMAHTADQIFRDELFDGDVNAIVDFKYATTSKLTWWFDHHQSAFLTPADAEHYHQLRPRLHYFDPAYRSCTKFIADVTKRDYGYEPTDLKQLVHWADIIDSASYDSPQMAVEMESAAQKLVLVIEASKGSETVQRIIHAMQEMPLEEIIALPEIHTIFQPLYDRHRRSIDVIQQHARVDKGVVHFDLIGLDMDGYNKFVPYYLFPQATYTVSVSEQAFRTKVSVGSSPWVKEIPHNLASICERYGGGGHPRVGAISFPVGQAEGARRAASEILAELQGTE
jgi:hypothetical protein